MTSRNLSSLGLVAALMLTGSDHRPLDSAEAGQTARRQSGGVPTFQVDRSWPKVPEKWKLGDASSVAVDGQDHVWLLHRPRTLSADQKALAAPPVLEFDAWGNFIQAWGGPGNGFEWPEREHGLYVDHKDHVWIGGNNCPENNLPGLKPVADDQLLKFTKNGKFVMQIGQSNKSGGNSDTRNFHQPADVFVYRKTNEVFVADGYGNHRMIVFDADTGAFKRMWGAFGNKPVDDARCPRPPVPPVTPEGQSGPPQFAIVHAARVSNDGFVYVADREHRRVQVFGIDGKYVGQVFVGRQPGTGGASVVAFSADPGQDFLYVGGGPFITMLDRRTLAMRGSFGGKGILNGIHHMAVDSKGNVYVASLAEGFQKAVFHGLSPASSQ
jgi:DNA-binding beta-propeller fold protein YncE